MRTVLAVILFGFGALVLAQAPTGEGSRGSIPPGTSKDGAKPSDGAITGGSILPGESAGIPESKTPSARALERCKELSGTLREECLRKQERDAATGGTTPRDVIPEPKEAPR